jgi:hypothetical protein
MQEAKTAPLTDAQKTFLGEVESLLKIYEAMHGLKAQTPSVPLGEGVVWARAIGVPNRSVAIVATRASLEAETFHVRLVSVPGETFVLQDAEAVGLAGLAQFLEKLIGAGRPLSRTRRRRR